jgi:HSP20 family protein
MARREYRDLIRQMEGDLYRFTEDAFMSFLDTSSITNRFWQPAADVHETGEAVVIKLEIAGVTVENVAVSLSGDGRHLSVGGVRTEQHTEREGRTGCHQLEIYYGPFERTFTIPPELNVDRDRIGATLKDGFLTITLPRRPKQALPSRSIPIEVLER